MRSYNQIRNRILFKNVALIISIMMLKCILILNLRMIIKQNKKESIGDTAKYISFRAVL